MWLLCLAVLFAVSIWQAWKAGPNLAVGTSIFCSLLVPTWLMIDLVGLPLNIQIAAGIAALSVYCLHRRAVFRVRLVLVDIAGIALVTVHVVSDWNADGFDWSVLLRAYGEWMVPYFAGRVAIQSWEDVRRLVPAVIGVCVVFAVCAITESLTKVNLFESLFGLRPLEGTPRHLSRLGLNRSYASTMNPIYFGTLQVMLVPWTCYAAVLAYRRSAWRWWLAAPLFPLAGIICSGSRAPLLSLVPLTYVSLFVIRPRWRRVLLGLGVGALALLIVFHQQALDGLQRWSNKFPDLPPPSIIVGGKEVAYTGTMHRIYLIQVYSTAMKRAGVLGFGTDRTTGFPPRVPVGPEHAATLKRLWCIDNYYVLIVLRFGLMGLLCFVVMGLAAAASFVSAGNGEGMRKSVFGGTMGGAVVAMLFILATVWMPNDIGFLYMWIMGASAGLFSHRHDRRTRGHHSRNPERNIEDGA